LRVLDGLAGRGAVVDADGEGVGAEFGVELGAEA